MSKRNRGNFKVSNPDIDQLRSELGISSVPTTGLLDASYCGGSLESTEYPYVSRIFNSGALQGVLFDAIEARGTIGLQATDNPEAMLLSPEESYRGFKSDIRLKALGAVSVAESLKHFMLPSHKAPITISKYAIEQKQLGGNKNTQLGIGTINPTLLQELRKTWYTFGKLSGSNLKFRKHEVFIPLLDIKDPDSALTPAELSKLNEYFTPVPAILGGAAVRMCDKDDIKSTG